MQTPAETPAATLEDLGEFGLIKQITADLGPGGAVRVGPGDDAAVVSVDGDIAISTDTMVDGVHFRTAWSAAHQIGQRAVASSVADLIAMGARPVAMVSAFSAPGDVAASWARECAQGMRFEADRAGITLAGGDVTSSSVITITMTVIGDLSNQQPILRSGARPGDEVGLRGRVGWAAAGLSVLRRGFRSPRAVVEAYQVPEVPYSAGEEAVAAGATAMLDVSDGLLGDLGHIARASGVRIDVARRAFTIPEPLAVVAAATGTDPWKFLLTGGEDHAMAATFPPGAVPAEWTTIGTVSAGDPEVLVDGLQWEWEAGFDHYRRR